MIKPAFEILNQRGTPMFFSDIFANRPDAGIVGRIFISTDTFAFYRDNGVTWDLIGGPGTGTITGSGTAFKYPVFSNTQEISDGSIEQFTNENKSTKDFFIETSTSGGFNETTLKLTNVFSGTPDSFTFKYGRTILAGSPFLEMRSNSVTFPTTRTLFNEGFVNFLDQYISVENSITNQVGYFSAVEPNLTIAATGLTNRAILTLSPSTGNYAGTIRTGSVLNTLEFQTGIPSVTRLSISATGTTTINDLAGTGTRMVVADSTGLLSTQAVPTISGSLATGQVAFGSATNTISGTNNLFWDSAQARLGIGTNVPTQRVTIYGGNALGQVRVGNGDNANWEFGRDNSVTGDFIVTNNISGNSFTAYRITQSSCNFIIVTGNLQVGSATPFAGNEKLQVTGNAHIQPSANTTPLTISSYSVTGSSANNALSITGTWNTTGAATGIFVNITNTASGANARLMDLRLDNNTIFYITKSVGGAVPNAPIASNGYGIGNGQIVICGVDGTNALTTSSTAFNFSDSLITEGYSYVFSSRQYVSKNYTSGTGGFIQVLRGYAPTSGTGVFNTMVLQPTINQQGGANGITRGLVISPTLTAAADWRSIEFNNSTGYGLYGSGSAPNYLLGNLQLGSATPTAGAEKLQVTGTANITGGLTISSSVAGNFGSLTLQNTSSATNARNVFQFSNNAGSVGLIDSFSSTYIGGGDDAANGLRILAQGSGGLSLRASASGGTIRFYIGSTESMRLDSNGNLQIADSENLIFGTTTGTKIGTATTQKLAFWNATPIIQPTTASASATFVQNSGTRVDEVSTFDGYTIAQVVKALRDLGILA
jgi:hypothetical protein